MSRPRGPPGSREGAMISRTKLLSVLAVAVTPFACQRGPGADDVSKNQPQITNVARDGDDHGRGDDDDDHDDGARRPAVRPPEGNPVQPQEPERELREMIR